MITAQRILLPVDFSEGSDVALSYALKVASASPHTHMELVHVIPIVMAPFGPEMVAFDYARLEEAQKKAALAQLQTFKEQIPSGVTVGSQVVEGNIPAQIARLCGEKNIDLVIMTTHGRRGMARLLEGSTTEETVRLAPCPVLVLHRNSTLKDVTAG